ncbi:hypothetical protein N7462_010043 [Penicillium macrosclerotiorum]|uniref:uncharacterized protein n=1 Tax=Penicillium macrosclerotiorum TaxID=303699 RepID=UPI002547396D|nr:uncharacterized protein N7462_010043 [Penicillium macrosclerotiorum]KAJ5668973.1 hypothetical protein N7462_010043 [Penicillium macrosclerotiorum]
MTDLWTFERANSIDIPNIASWHATNSQSDPYAIQVSWPLGWPGIDGTEGVSEPANILYAVDGNAMFLTATEAIRRRQSTTLGQLATIVVAISYLVTDSVYSARRNFDLTPPTSHFVPFPGTENQTQAPYGGADILLDFILNDVHPYIVSNVFPNVTVENKILFGHSYGGLFTLNAMFKKPESFDTFLAASPSIWWSNRTILKEESAFYQKSIVHKPNIFLSYGVLEDNPVRTRNETEADYQEVVRQDKIFRMGPNVEELASRLRRSHHIQNIKKRSLEDEDHESAVGAALSGAIYWFLGL